jgi:hypothetical protein
MRYKIHKADIWYNICDRDNKLISSLCNQAAIKFQNDMTKDWKKVTCKKCLKLRKQK